MYPPFFAAISVSPGQILAFDQPAMISKSFGWKCQAYFRQLVDWQVDCLAVRLQACSRSLVLADRLVVQLFPPVYRPVGP